MRRARRRATAWSAFHAGRFTDAIATFSWLNENDTLDASELHALVELRRDAGEPLAAAAEIALALARNPAGLDDHAWLVEAIELVDASAAASAARGDLALRLLELAAEQGDVDTWRSLGAPALLPRLERLFPDPARRLDALEQLTFAPPETGLPTQAIDRIAAIGHVAAADPAVSRAAERLLHDLGQTAAAYAVERARRAARRSAGAPPAPGPMPPRDILPRGLVVVIAGGHPALRSLVRRDLARDGIDQVRDIPSAREGVRSGRDVAAMLSGADVAVLLIRQIAHSTGEQVKSAARRAGVPVIAADSAGTSGVRRALMRYLAGAAEGA